jgi:hypothetical protein
MIAWRNGLKIVNFHSPAVVGWAKMALQVVLGAIFLWHFFMPTHEALIIVSNAQAKEATKRVIGGPCEYQSYPGQATIASIRKIVRSENVSEPSYESYEVIFTFSTKEKVKETYGRVQGKRFRLKLANSWHPGPKFLKKYAIEEWKRFDCTLNVITKGSCTPTVFEFPTIDLADYFEALR